MQRRFIITMSITIMLLLVFACGTTKLGQSQAFSGQRPHGPVEAGTFDCSGVCRITWTTGHYEGSDFSVHIFESREGSRIVDLGFGTFDGVEGMTYIYGIGTYTIEVFGNVNSWYISVEALNFEQLEPSTYFIGSEYSRESRQINTGTFTCPGFCEITWTGAVMANIIKVEYAGLHSQKTTVIAKFDGVDGKTYLYDEGTFFFQTLARPQAWEIRVNPLDMDPLEYMEPISYFSGVGSNTTGIFTCSEHCEITWATEFNPSEWPCIIIYVNKPDKQDPVKQVTFGKCEGSFAECYGMNGTIDLWEKGTFYFTVDAFRLLGWNIYVEDVPIVPEYNVFLTLNWGLIGGLLAVLVIQRLRKRHSK